MRLTGIKCSQIRLIYTSHRWDFHVSCYQSKIICFLQHFSYSQNDVILVRLNFNVYKVTDSCNLKSAYDRIRSMYLISAFGDPAYGCRPVVRARVRRNDAGIPVDFVRIKNQEAVTGDRRPCSPIKTNNELILVNNFTNFAGESSWIVWCQKGVPVHEIRFENCK